MLSRILPPLMVSWCIGCLVGAVVVCVTYESPDYVGGLVIYLVSVLALVLGVGVYGIVRGSEERGEHQ
jgi:hypothetical protein